MKAGEGTSPFFLDLFLFAWKWTIIFVFAYHLPRFLDYFYHVSTASIKISYTYLKNKQMKSKLDDQF